MDRVLGLIIAHEQGELSAPETLDLFSHLITAGGAGKLQGHYGRTARDLIQFGWITPAGLITTEGAVYAAGPPDWSS
jgi:hypothetical protein